MPRIDRMVGFLQRRAAWVIAIAAALAAAGGILSSRLELRTSFAELLPSKDPGVVVLDRMQERLGGFESLVVAIESPSREANLRFAAALADRLRALPPDLVQIVRYQVRAERAFFRDRRFLYAKLTDLESVRDRLEQDLMQKKNPLDVPIDEAPSWDAIRARVEARRSEVPDLPDGVFATKDGAFVAVVVIPQGGLFGGKPDRLVAAVRARIAALSPQNFDPRMRVGLSGDIFT